MSGTQLRERLVAAYPIGYPMSTDKLPNMGKGNHHLLDYALYWSNIRENVSERVDAFNGKTAPE